MADTFDFDISYTSEVDEIARIKSVQFGDGYRQDSDDGINPTAQTWSIIMNTLDDATHEAVITFLRSQKGTVYFLWTPPVSGYDVEIAVKCTEWKSSAIEFNSTTVTCVFQQVFEIDSSLTSPGEPWTDNAALAFTDNADNPWILNT